MRLRDSGESVILPSPEQTLNQGDDVAIRRSEGRQLLGRGVWQIPVLGPNGEPILVAVDQHHHIVGDICIVADGASRVDAADELLRRLDDAEPTPLTLLSIRRRG